VPGDHRNVALAGIGADARRGRFPLGWIVLAMLAVVAPGSYRARDTPT
jgi:hypothetical protein